MTNLFSSIAFTSLLVTAACSTGDTDTVVGGGEDPTCATTQCDGNATCSEASGAPVCACNPGFTGDGATCADVDECATPNTCGDKQACVNASAGFDCLPTSCAGVLQSDALANDGEYTLYVGGDPAKSWTAYCAGMQLTTGPQEYLPLLNVFGDANFSQYSAGGNVQGTTVRTHYIRLRIDPATLVVDTGDLRFASSTGKLMHGTEEVTWMPYAVAMACASDLVWGSANIDLRGTPFAVNETFVGAGAGASGNVAVEPSGQFVDIGGGGACGWFGPPSTPFNPFNKTGGTLALRYAE